MLEEVQTFSAEVPNPSATDLVENRATQVVGEHAKLHLRMRRIKLCMENHPLPPPPSLPPSRSMEPERFRTAVLISQTM